MMAMGDSLYFEAFGDNNKIAVVFLHGWGGNCSVFYPIIQRLPRNLYYYVAVDFAGFGKSEEPSRPYCVDDYANEVLALLQSLKINKYIILGHSFGGRVAIKLGSRKLPGLLGVVLVDSAGIKPKYNVINRFKIKLYKLTKKLVGVGLLKSKLLQNRGSEDYKKLNGNMRTTFVKVVNEDLSKDARKIAVPTVIFWGRKDKATPLYMAKKLKRLISNSQLIVYNGAGHYCYLDNLEDFVYSLFMFLNGIKE